MLVTLFGIFVIWFLASIPLALLVGRLLQARERAETEVIQTVQTRSRAS